MKIGPDVEQDQVARLADFRKSRDPFKMAGALEELQEAASCSENLMPYLVDCCHAYATVGEMVARLKRCWGEFQEPVKL